MFSPDSSGYEAIRRPAGAAYRKVRPRLVVLCRSVSDVARAMAYATRRREDRIAPRCEGHCFAGRPSTDGIVLDMSGLDGISVQMTGSPRSAPVSAWDRCTRRSTPMAGGCGPTVGIKRPADLRVRTGRIRCRT